MRADVRPFIEDMAEAYGWADLVICRAGALTVSELAAAGVGAMLVPFPAAVDDHQTHNARFLVREGAAVLIADRELTAERLAARAAAAVRRAAASCSPWPSARAARQAACRRGAGRFLPRAGAGGRMIGGAAQPVGAAASGAAPQRRRGAIACAASTPSISSASAAAA